ncbi:MAG: protein kinase [Candidatus Hydrogenedentes bacterium]|nr:protein kinase [Candidatus Hydrogenedentota bacterium]
MSRLYVIACSCGKRLVIGQEMLGKSGKCVHCGQPVLVDPKLALPYSEEGPTEEEKRQLANMSNDGVPVEWKQGDVILDLYEVTGLLGEGGMGKVYKVIHRGWNMPLAVKSPKARIVLRSDGAANFEQECETWVNLGLHPHIVSCHYVRRLGGVPRVFAEYVDDGSIWEWIQNGRLYKGGPQKALARICDFGVQMCWGLQHAHDRGLVHQDVKNANVLIAGGELAKVTDFGLARARALVDPDSDPGNVSGDVTNVGMTRFYCSPEQSNREKLSKKTDMWSWAMSMLEMFTVKVVWYKGTEGPAILNKFLEQSVNNPRMLPIPAPLAAVMKRCLDVNQENRPESMNEIAAHAAEAYKVVTGQPYPRTQPRATEALANSLNNRALSLLDLGRGQHAEQTWATSLKADPHHPETTYNWGLYRWRTGRLTDDALLLRLNDIAKFHPRERMPQWLLAQVYMEQSEFRQAARILRELAQAMPERRDVHDALRTAELNMPATRRMESTYEAHQDALTCIACSRDGKFLLTGSEDNTIRMWDRHTAICVRAFEGHTNSITSVHFTSDAQIVMSSSEDRTVKLWNANNGSCLRTLEGHTDAVQDVAFSEDGHIAVSASLDGTLRVWDVRERKCEQVLEGHYGGVLSIAMDPPALCGVTAGQDGIVKVWDVRARRCTHAIQGHQGPVNAICMSDDCRVAISGGEDRTLRVWHPGSGKLIATFEGHQAPVRGVALSYNGQFAASCGLDKTVRLWDVATGRCISTLSGHTNETTGVAFPRDLKQMFSSSRDKKAAAWCLGITKDGHTAPTIICQAVSSEAAQSMDKAFEGALAAARKSLEAGDALGAANFVRQARSQSGRRRAPEAMSIWRELYTRLPRTSFNGAWEHATISEIQEPISEICLTTGGRIGLVVSGKNTMAIWDLIRINQIQTFEKDTGSIEAASMSFDGKSILTGAWEIKLWDASTGAHVRTFDRQSDIVNALAIGPDGKFALSAQAASVRLWETATGRAMGELQGHVADVNTVAWSSDGRLAITGGEDKRILVWEIATGRCLLTMEGHTQSILSCCFSFDGLFAITGGGSIWQRPGEVKVWDLTSGQCVHTFEGHGDSVTCVDISADSRYVLSGSRDKTVKMWDMITGKHVYTFEGHGDGVETCAFTRDGRYMISGSKDQTIRVWALDWALDDRPPAPWDPGAEPLVRNFLTSCTPYGAELDPNREANEKKIMQALTRRGSPKYGEADLNRLFFALGCGGYGWLHPQGVMQIVERMASSWHLPKGLPERPGAEAGMAQALMRRFFSR